MRIATWNVNSGTVAERTNLLREKYAAQIVCLQECERPSRECSTVIWRGDSQSKGLSIAYEGKIQPWLYLESASPSLAATIAESDIGEFNILLIWAKPSPTYFDDVMETLDAYDSFIKERNTVLMGDFNLDVRIREKGRQFYTVNARLNREFNLFSAYHEFTDERFGMETMPTLYFNWGYKGCYHCDFIYLPADWIHRIADVHIAPYREWESSDHRPVICEIA